MAGSRDFACGEAAAIQGSVTVKGKVQCKVERMGRDEAHCVS